MMRATYLLRFDDLCPTMNWGVWNEVETTLVELGVRPILAVIPDNRDESLRIDPPEEAFWERVRTWQARGWTIAVHGYQHLYVTEARGLFGWNHRSEFAGLTYEQQDEKIGRSVEIFRRERVEPEAWIAPNHSFDLTTLAVLRNHGIEIVSDGLGLYPYRDEAGMIWVPMQTWRLEPRPPGVWTVCLHHNHWKARDVDAFRRDLAKLAGRMTDMAAVLERYGGRRRGWVDRLFAAQRGLKKRIRRSSRRVSTAMHAGS